MGRCSAATLPARSVGEEFTQRVWQVLVCRYMVMSYCAVPCPLWLDPAWFIAKPEPKQEAVMSVAQWKERFVLVARANMFFLHPEKGLYT